MDLSMAGPKRRRSEKLFIPVGLFLLLQTGSSAAFQARTTTMTTHHRRTAGLELGKLAASRAPVSRSPTRMAASERTRARESLVVLGMTEEESVVKSGDDDEQESLLLENDHADVELQAIPVLSTLSSAEASASSVRSTRFRTTSYDLIQASVVGVVTGLSVALFKLSIEALREICYGQGYLATRPFLMASIPTFGGLLVGGLLLLGQFPPGLRGTVKEVDSESRAPVRDIPTLIKSQLNFIRKSMAAVATLGTGCSLGPEGPCVEIGMSVSRACMDIQKRQVSRRLSWNRLLLSCGAAAGVAAGFNAPIAGVFFALEVMQGAFSSESEDAEARGETIQESGGIFSSSASITPVLLSSVISALIARTLLGNHLVLVLTEYSLKTPLVELPLYLLLGVISGFVAFSFSLMAKFSENFFKGNFGSDGFRSFMRSVPSPFKPVIGGALCGLVGLVFPQILFFGYETLNSLLSNNTLSTTLLLTLLVVKMVMTAVSAGSGLVGGTFAPSLFLGAMTGASFHNIMTVVFQSVVLYWSGGAYGLSLELADVPAYAMVGAASVLSSLFRAPLTASLLLFELTRDYDVILPLMASAGVGCVVADILDNKRQEKRRRDQDPVSWGDLADRSSTESPSSNVASSN